MDAAAVATVRRFNRRVTQRIGVLDDEYLARGRPAGRVPDPLRGGRGRGEDVRSLRRRLGLDSGYLSRLLRSLEQEGLVTVGARPTPTAGSASSRRTPDGQAEFDVMEGLSDELAWSLLDPLD